MIGLVGAKLLWFLLLAALAGLGFFLFLPVVMGGMIFFVAMKKMLHIPDFSWRPNLAYLRGKGRKKDKKAPKEN